jgi:hypothetical protein
MGDITRSGRSRPGRLGWSGVVVAGLLLATGCFGTPTIDARYDAGSVHLAIGELLRVEIGEVNTSIGDSWHVIGEPDRAVLGPGKSDLDYDDCPEGHVGCSGRLWWTFPAVGKGVTGIVFRYCYRSRPGPDCAPEPSRGPAEPVTLTVTVG